MNQAILNNEVQEYINNHLYEDTDRILFKGSPFKDITGKELVEQLESKRASEKKLPTWFHTEGIYFPAKLSIEQTSSEITGEYKSELIRGKNILDLTGGFGVDTYFFSKKASFVTHFEINPALSAIARYNASLLDVDNVTFEVGDGMGFLQKSSESYDTIYIDPSRRKTDKRVFLLTDCEPDVVENLDLLLLKTRRIIIKTSPLLDIQSGLRQLKHVSQIHIVSVKNDCKEVLWVIDREFVGEPEIVCVAFNDRLKQRFIFKISEEKDLKLENFFAPENYLYEPDVALMKAGCFKLITKRFEIRKLNPNTHLYTSQTLEEDFVGKRLKIISVLDYKAFSKNKGFSKANIISRNFPLTTQEIKKKFKLKDGGDDFLVFATGPYANLLTIHAIRV